MHEREGCSKVSERLIDSGRKRRLEPRRAPPQRVTELGMLLNRKLCPGAAMTRIGISPPAETF